VCIPAAAHKPNYTIIFHYFYIIATFMTTTTEAFTNSNIHPMQQPSFVPLQEPSQTPLIKAWQRVFAGADAKTITQKK